MDSVFKPVASLVVPCKCCNGQAKLYGVVDFNQYCGEVRQPLLERCGIPIYYHRCEKCGFIFTVAFDSFSREDFTRWIYNDQYSQVDPEYKEVRPRAMAERLIRMFSGSTGIRILDYGGGNGKLAELMHASGFKSVDTYDPFVPQFSARPVGHYDLIVSFEVAEHAPQPVETFGDMKGLLAGKGMLVFATQVQPPDIEFMRTQWWYIAPRNGHVSIYTPAALNGVAVALDLRFMSFDTCWHTMFQQVPFFAQHLFQTPPA